MERKEKLVAMETIEKSSVRSALLEERRRHCHLVLAMKPFVVRLPVIIYCLINNNNNNNIDIYKCVLLIILSVNRNICIILIIVNIYYRLIFITIITN